MRLPLPGPSAVIGGAAAAAEAVETAIGLVPRAAAALTRVEALLDRVDAVVDRAEQAVERANAVVTSAAESADGARTSLATVEIVARDAGRAVDGAAGVLDRVDASLSAWEPTLRRLAPSAKRFAESIDPKEVDAAIGLVDRMPVLLDHVENDVLPVLQNLDRVGPDVHALLEVVEDLRRVLTGLPGVSLLRRRGDDDSRDD